MPENEKYVVHGRDEWNRMMNALRLQVPASIVDAIMEKEIPDAVVIRRQDSFAPPALDGYANSIQVALEVDEKFTKEPNPRADHLRNVADYFHQQAALSWQADRKIPD